jgi:hypothetical protein
MRDVDTTSEEDEPVPSPSARRKRGRSSTAPKSYVESDATTGEEEEEAEFAPMLKKVKVEPVDQQGGAAVANSNTPLEEEDEGVSFI